MKVAHFIDSGGLYGAEKMLLTLCTEQLKQGLEPLVVSCGVPDEAPKAIEIACEKAQIPYLPWRMKPGLNIRGCKKLLKHLEPMGFDIFHSHGYKFNILLSVFSSVNSKLNFIATCHGYTHTSLFSQSGLIAIADRLCRTKAACNIYVSNELKERGSTLPWRRNQVVIHNGISPNSKDSINLNVEDYFLYVGRISQEKGITRLLSALDDLKIDIRLKVLGEGPLLEDLKMKHSSTYIEFHGYKKNPEDLISGAKALIIPSYQEGVPITLLEAINRNTPVITTKVGGIPEILGDDYPYYIKQNKNTSFKESLGTAIEKLLSSKQFTYTDAIYGRITSDLMSTRYLNTYKQVLKQ